MSLEVEYVKLKLIRRRVQNKGSVDHCLLITDFSGFFELTKMPEERGICHLNYTKIFTFSIFLNICQIKKIEFANFTIQIF